MDKLVEKCSMTGKDWERINQGLGIDVLDIVVNLDNRFTPTQQAEKIVERCDKVAKDQLTKAIPIIHKVDQARITRLERHLALVKAESDGFATELLGMQIKYKRCKSITERVAHILGKI